MDAAVGMTASDYRDYQAALRRGPAATLRFQMRRMKLPAPVRTDPTPEERATVRRANRAVRQRRYLQRNLAAVNAARRARARANPLPSRIRQHRRRARERGADGSFTLAEWRELVARYGGRCAYCGAGGPLEVEHRVALARGGSNAIENILPSCRDCNLHKGTKIEAAFRRADWITDALRSRVT